MRSFARDSLDRLDGETLLKFIRYIGSTPEQFRRDLATARLEHERTVRHEAAIEKQLKELRSRSVYDMIAEGAPIGDEPNKAFGEVDGRDQFSLSKAVRLNVYHRDVAAGPFAVVDTHAQPDDVYYIAKEDIASHPPSRLFVLRIRGDSMLDQYRSGDKIICERLDVSPETLAGLTVDDDYIVCQGDDGCTFKQLVENGKGSMVLMARNKDKYPADLRVPWRSVQMLARVLGRIEYSVSFAKPKAGRKR